MAKLEHMIGVISNFQVALDPSFFIRNNQGATRQHQRPKRSLSSIGDAFNWCCGVATQEKVNSLVDQQQHINHIVSQLRSGLHDDYKNLQDVSAMFNTYQEKAAA